MYKKLLLLFMIISHFEVLKCLTRRKGDILVRIYSTGFTPFDDDILPYGLIHSIHGKQVRYTKQRGWKKDHKTFNYKRPTYAGRSETVATAQSLGHYPAQTVLNAPLWVSHKTQFNRPQMHFEPLKSNSKQFNLYDEDGEILLDLKYHDNAFPLTKTNQKEGMRMQIHPNRSQSTRNIKHFWLHL